MPELAKSVLRITKSSSQLVFNGLPPDDPKQRKPNIELA
jgi:UDP-glucuronate decarboxylase